MKKNGFSERYSKIHFIGVGGVSMSGLAKFCIERGKEVSGSDIYEGDEVKKLKALGVKIYSGHCAENVLGKDLVVYSSAIGEDNAELKAAREAKTAVKKRSEFLGDILNSFENSIAVCGCHGKTTTTAMISHAFTEAGKRPTVFLGGVDGKADNYLSGKTEFAILEACEYKKNFLDLSPTLAVVLNVDDDHLDSYGSLENVKKAFGKFTRGRLSVINADDENSKGLLSGAHVTFGIKENATYTAEDIIRTQEGHRFTVRARETVLGEINLKIPGIYNVYNALAAVAVCDSFFLNFEVIKKALGEFCGVKRRMEKLGKAFGMTLYADYAHHPKEISSAIEEFQHKDGDFLAVFQPHTYSRTKNLMGDFVNCFKNLKTAVIYETYAAREKFDMQGSAYALFCNLKKETAGEVFYAETEEELKKIVSGFSGRGKTVLFLGAGDVYDTAKRLIEDENGKG